MKTYFDLVLSINEAVATKGARKPSRKPFDSTAFDAQQRAKYGSVMAKAAADALAASQKRKAALAQPSKKTLPWVTSPKMFPAWWHPTKEAHAFSISGAGYHVTQLVKHPEKFGIYGSDLIIAAEEEAEERSKYSSRGISPKQLLDDIRKEDIDNAWSISMLAYANGWLRVYGGKFHTGEFGGTLEGTDRKSIKGAIREIEQAAEMAGVENIRIDVAEVSQIRHQFPKFTKLDTKAKRDAYLRG